MHLPDPIADALKQMATPVATLEREVAMLARGGARVRPPRWSRCARAWPGARGRVAWGLVPSFSHSVELPRPPAAVFPWLLERGQGPQWTSDLQSLLGRTAARPGRDRAPDALNVAGGIKLNMEIASLRPAARRRDRASRPTA